MYCNWNVLLQYKLCILMLSVIIGKMSKEDFCGCCSLETGAVLTGILVSGFNGGFIYWFSTSLNAIETSNELYWVLRMLLLVLTTLAGIHILISLALIYGVVKRKSELLMLWIVFFLASGCIVSSLFTIGLAFLYSKIYLLIILFNLSLTFSVVMTFRLYRKLVEEAKKECI